MFNFQMFAELLWKLKSMITSRLPTLKHLCAVVIIVLMLAQEIFILVALQAHVADALGAGGVVYRLTLLA